MSAVEDFFSAWGLADADERRREMTAALAPEVSYVDPMTPEPIEGPDAVAAYVDAFAANAPGATATVVAHQDRHSLTRVTVEFRMADGAVQYGQYFVEFDADERPTRLVGFVGLGEPPDRAT